MWEHSTRRIVWPLAIIVAITLVAVGFTQYGLYDWHDSLYTVPILWVGVLVAAAWMLLGPGVPPLFRARSAMAWVLLSVVFVLCFSFDGYTGNRLLRFSWRWRLVSVPVVEENAGPVDLTPRPGDWSGFRDADQLGELHGIPLATDWEAQPPECLWRQSMGPGWSPFVTAGELCITQAQHGDDEAILGCRIETGEILWEHRYKAKFHDVMGGTGPRTSPVLHDGRVYTLGATGMVTCLNAANGKQQWQVDALTDCKAPQPRFGYSCSPLVAAGNVVIAVGGPGMSLVAYDLKTGKRQWAVGSTPATYSSPLLVTLAGRQQILVFSNEGLFGHDPATGEILWKFDWPCPEETDNVTPPLPVFAEGAPDRVLISTGYGVGSALLEFSTPTSITELWRSRGLKAKFTSLAYHKGYVYGLDDNILVCLDLADGSRMWKGGRYGYGQLVLVDNLLLIQAESGEVVLVEATPDEHREVTRFPALRHRTWSHPVLAQRQYLLVRNDREAACYRLPIRTGEAE